MEKIIYGYHSKNEVKGYYTVEFYDADGNNKNHWLSGNQIQYFLNREDAVKYIESVKGWNVFRFEQTLIIKIK